MTEIERLRDELNSKTFMLNKAWIDLATLQQQLNHLQRENKQLNIQVERLKQEVNHENLKLR